MKTMNLNAAGVMELSAAEVCEVNGGWIKEAFAALADTIENWDTYVAAFKKGFSDGQKVLN